MVLYIWIGKGRVGGGEREKKRKGTPGTSGYGEGGGGEGANCRGTWLVKKCGLEEPIMAVLLQGRTMM